MQRFAIVALAALLAACDASQEFHSNPGPGPGAADAAPPPTGDADCSGGSDPDNCGACGHRCLGGTCSAGQCASVVLASGQGNSAHGAPWYPYATDIGDALVGPDRLAVDKTHVYWANLRGEIMRVPISGGDVQRVTPTAPGAVWLALDDERVYFTTLGGALFRVAKSGGAPVRLAPAVGTKPAGLLLFGGPYPSELLLKDGTLYWASAEGIHACAAPDCPSAELVDHARDGQRPFSYAIDASGLEYASVELSDVPGETSYVMTVFRENQWLGLRSPSAYYELHGGAGEVFAISKSDFGINGIVRWSEQSLTVLASGDQVGGTPRGLALDDDYVYWANAAPARIDVQERRANVVRCKRSGCASPEVLAEAQLVPRAVATSGEAVFWTTGDGKVMKLAKPAGSQKPLK